MKFYIEYLQLIIIVSFIIDYSGIIESIKRGLYTFVNGKKMGYRCYTIPLIECSLCVTFWLSLVLGIYLNLPFLYILTNAVLSAYSVIFVTEMLKFIYNLYNRILNKI